MTRKPAPATVAATEFDPRTNSLLFAWIVAMIATFTVIFLGEIAGQVPCNLCWYQRIAMFPLAVILGIASFRGDTGIWPYGLGLAVIGVLVAGFHVLFYYGVLPAAIEPCGQGPSCTSTDMLFLGVPLPVLSLAAFVAITIALTPFGRSAR